MDTVVAAPRALLGRTITGPASVRVRAGRIVEVVTGAPPEDAEVLTDGLLTPGLVDVQVNGAVGVDFAEVDDEGMRFVARSLPKTGVTRFLPTLITAPVPVALRQARAVLAASAALPDNPGARPLGVHLEGPFLSPQRPGVHDPALMVEPGPAEIDLLLADDLRPALRLVTLAPERPGGLAAVRRLSAAGVLVAVGHSDATGEQTRAAAEAGARMVTHLFNAQRPLGHREPGVPGVALVDDRFTLGLIADLAHVGPDVCRLVFNAAGHRVALVTDAVAAAGMPPGRYQLGGADVVLAEDGVPRSPEGTIAGSALTLDRAVRNLVEWGLATAAEAVRMASDNPRRLMAPALAAHRISLASAEVEWSRDLRPSILRGPDLGKQSG